MPLAAGAEALRAVDLKERWEKILYDFNISEHSEIRILLGMVEKKSSSERLLIRRGGVPSGAAAFILMHKKSCKFLITSDSTFKV